MSTEKNYNAPKTEFPMRANLPSLEKRILDSVPCSTSNTGDIILHDGPPYANGNIHVGHAYNKILKNVFARFINLMNLKDCAHFVCGWDCHGLPIELAVEKNSKDYPQNIVGYKSYANDQMQKQKKQFERLGIKINHTYETMSNDFEDMELKSFQDLAKKGLVKVKKRPVHWCWSCKTALAESELEYKNVIDNSVWVLFPSVEEPNLSFLVWTTTPWTLKANQAIAFKQDCNYAIVGVKVNDEERQVVVSEWFAKNILGVDRLHYTLIDSKYFLGKTYKDPFGCETDARPIFAAEFVSEEQGTGFVHIAPSCGKEDYLAYTENFPKEEIHSYTNEDGKIGNIFYKKANKLFVEDLQKQRNVYKTEDVNHSYAHCWRCSNPTIQRATEQVFLDFASQKELILNEAEKITFFPKKSKNRFLAFVGSRTEWCISRQRSWGVPIPMYYCSTCDKTHCDLEVATVEQWRNSSYIPKCETCNKSDSVQKKQDILDVWLDSGLTYKTLPNKKSHYVIEGSDQHRGWFQSSHILSCLLEGETCLTNVVSHGFVLDEKGNKMSKSLGNVIDPLAVCDQRGAEILYLWALSQTVGEDIRIGNETLELQSGLYRKIRNTMRYLLSNLYDFDIDEMKHHARINEDCIVELTKLESELETYFSNFEFHRFLQSLANYLNDLSAGYIDKSKAVLYESPANSPERREIQMTYHVILDVLIQFCSLFMPFTSKEIEEYRNKERFKNETISEH